jgi:ADP-ribose pyrophosphatase YjhB (NUDIX family)
MDQPAAPPGAPAEEPYVDSSGKPLDAHPHPSLAVDTVLLTLARAEAGSPALAVWLTPARRPKPCGGDWTLPGAFLHEGETLADAVARSLEVKAGFAGIKPRQLQVFDALGRDDRGWVVSVAHLAAVSPARFSALAGGPPEDFLSPPGRAPDAPALFPADALPESVAFDHAKMVRAAVGALRAEYADRPDPAGLLEEPFTLSQLRAVHQAVGAPDLKVDSFRRRMSERLDRVGRTRPSDRGRPAQLFRRQTGQ